MDLMDQSFEIAAPRAVRLAQETSKHLDVAAGHEVVTGSAQNHGANRVILLAPRQTGGKRFGQGGISALSAFGRLSVSVATTSRYRAVPDR